jgi:RsiW-degrading membrane proteinase PrsW (M82 family)
MTCRSCRRDVPDAIFCTECGADQRGTAAPSGPGAGRRDRFAAHPDEPVLRLGILTTLLPHLDHDRVDEFRWALYAGLGVIFVLYVAGFITAAILAAAFLVPVLYVLYLYEVRTYRDAPASVFGLTMGAGFALGAVGTVVANQVRGPIPAIDGSGQGIEIDVASLLVTAIAIPIAFELLKPLPALLLRRRPEFGLELDGMVFGVAAGLGFALAQTIIQYGALFATLDVRTDPANWIFPLVSIGITVPLLHGSSTGVVTAALWKRGRSSIRGFELAGVAVAIASHIAFIVGSTAIVALGRGRPVLLIWQGLVVGAMLLYVRYLLHRALLEEATAFGFDRLTCPNCRETATASNFCPTCGMALAAATNSVHAAPAAPRAIP